MAENFYSYNKLTCVIQIGDYDLSAPRHMVTKYAFEEVVGIQIKDSYQTLTNSAKVTLPRDILLSLSKKDEDGVREEVLLRDASSIIKKGQRISIFLGYDDNNKIMFDGFVVSIEAKSPFTLYCEDFGWKLKKTSVEPTVSPKSGTILNDFLPPLLENTGISIHPLTEAMDIRLGQVRLEKSRSIGELLESWKRNYGLMSFIKFYDGEPYLALSRTYFSTNSDKTLIDGESSSPPILDFQDNVVTDNLKFSYLDYDTLGLEAIALYPDNSRFKVSLITNKSYDAQKAKYDLGQLSEPPEEFEIVNESKISKKQAKKNFKDTSQIKDNILNVRNLQDKFDMSQYNIRTYHEYNVDRDTLIANAKAKFKEISQTGVDGNVVIFGDFGIRSASMVRCYDARNIEKNGLYIVSNVVTDFGLNGYRQTLSIPYKRGQ